MVDYVLNKIVFRLLIHFYNVLQNIDNNFQDVKSKLRM